MFQYQAVSNPQSSFWLSSTVVLPGFVVGAAGSSRLKMSTWQLLQVLLGPQRASARRVLGCFKALSAGRVLHLREKERREGAGWALPSPGCSHQFGVFPAVLCMQTSAGLRGGEGGSQCIVVLTPVSLELPVSSAGAAPAPYPVPFGRGIHCNHGQGCSAVAAASCSLKEKAIYSPGFLRVLNWPVGFFLTWKK